MEKKLEKRPGKICRTFKEVKKVSKKFKKSFMGILNELWVKFIEILEKNFEEIMKKFVEILGKLCVQNF